MTMVKESVEVPAGGSGKSLPVTGELAAVRYDRPGVAPYDAGATADVDLVHGDLGTEPALTGVGLDSSDTWYPRAPVHDVTGAEITGETARRVCAGSNVRINVIGGGAGVGTFTVFIKKT